MQRLKSVGLLCTLSSLLLALVFSAKTAGAEDRCALLAALKLDHATVTSAALVPARATLAHLNSSSTPLQIIQGFCQVKILDTPTSDSEIRSEVWLPISGWDGRYKGLGNGGFAGLIAYDQMAAAVGQGMAVAATDAGHVGGTAEFALGHPEKVKDFGWRAIHDMTVQAKVIIQAFYGNAPKHSYFMACSDGGREALMEAQRFPRDYDGILAGAPAYNWTALVSSGAVDERQLHSSAAAYISPAKLPAIGAAVRAACDVKDGVTDGVLNDPRACHFNTAVLACKSAETDACLTTEQLLSLHEIYAMKKDAKGAVVYPGFLPGAEDVPGSWDTWVVGERSLMVFFGTSFFADFVYEEPSRTLSSFDFDRDYALATAKTGAALNATDTDLKPFADRGGRLILYHGWNDPAIPALGTVDYYDRAASALGKSKADDSMRLYMVPGMLHCGGGPGVTVFGEDGRAVRGDATHDVFTALEQWVEAGRAPETLTATKFVDDSAGKPVLKTRPLCAYPAAAQYVKGDPNDAKSFVCKEPKR